MPKLKTRKSLSKRIIVTKTGKLLKKKCGRDHFNARESGNITRNKRRDTQLNQNKSNNNILREMPYSN